MVEMLKQLFQLNRDYKEAKEKAIEQSINVFESKNNPLLAALFSALLIWVWLFAIFDDLKNLCEKQESFSVVGFFVISYFSLFLGSKFIFKPSDEELADDTSVFALFSACRRKEFRSLTSIGLSLFHTLLFVLYLASKDVTCF